MSTRTVLLDGDTVLFAATSAAQSETQWDDDTDVVHRYTNMDDAKQRLVSSVDRIMGDLGGEHLVIALSCAKEDRFRPKIMPTYKNNRDGKLKPVGYYQLREWVEDEYDTYIRPTLEGDDVLGILATHPKLYPGEKIIAAIDKDLKTIPGKLYNYDKKTLEKITFPEADRFFIKQALMGDRTDGYPGCPGVGPKTSEKILDKALEEMNEEVLPVTAEDYWPYVVEAYEKKGLSEEVALMNARVARILRATDYDYKNKEPILWTPSP